MTAEDPRIAAARAYLAETGRTELDHLPPSQLMTQCAEARRHLAAVLAIAGEQGGARQLSEIRALLAGFDWEHHDRQLALEEIERIVTAEEPYPDRPMCTDDIDPNT